MYKKLCIFKKWIFAISYFQFKSKTVSFPVHGHVISFILTWAKLVLPKNMNLCLSGKPLLLPFAFF